MMLVSFILLFTGEVMMGLWPYMSKLFFDILASGTPEDAALVGQATTVVIVLLITVFAAQLFRRGSGFLNGRWLNTIYVRVQRKAYDYVLYHSEGYFQNRFTGAIASKIRSIGEGCYDIWELVITSVMPLVVRIGLTVCLP